MTATPREDGPGGDGRPDGGGQGRPVSGRADAGRPDTGRAATGRAATGRADAAAGPWPGPPRVDPGRVDPGVLGALLARHGWVRRGGPADRYGRWTPPGGEASGLSLLVPAGRAFDDADELLAEALAALVRSPLPSARSVLLALDVPGDEVRWEREAPGADGAVPWEAEDALRAAAAAMLRAAAKAAHTRAAFFGARLDGHAAAFLRQVLVAGPGSGAGRLTAHVPAPEGRGATTVLVRSLEALRDAVDYRRATGRPEAFDGSVGAGVSRELAASVAQLVRGSEGAQVALAWSPAAGTPRGFTDRRPPVEFSPGDLPALEEAVERLERAELAVEVRITGAVVRLGRPRPDGAGAVRLRVLAGADVAEVRVRLEEEEYRTAVRAHLAGVPLRLGGRLEPGSGFRRLVRPRGVEPCELDDAERDRLLKALRDRPEEDAP
ncbi:hypothetical protein LO771_02145 [Streptacidiphilus sp. ASG 303]|uniref:hypothetical protein n=1 Tax=Streptacidiphilus sp. ASG 303 TaxID=2896847 RepID=UPI001E47AA01|nr:hypothetical protein [Streptacidiphilus sp. ASG 303]MCD0481244.1 hypothetical protein [Streptacidiphilus sp. ASG 303]